MKELVKYSGKGDALSFDGVLLAPCNNPVNNLSVAEIKRSRETEIDKQLFTEYLTYFCELHNRILSKPTIAKVYRTLNEVMGNDEFVAACEDLLKTKFYFADLVALLTAQVERQRELGPDLFQLEMGEL